MLPQTNSTFLNAIAPPAGASSHLCFKEIPSRTMAGTGLGDVFGRSLVRGLSLRFVQNIQGGLCLGGRAIPAGAILLAAISLFSYLLYTDIKRPSSRDGSNLEILPEQGYHIILKRTNSIFFLT